MRFRTNDALRMLIDSSGNVGIGTDSPFEDLEINRDNSSPTLIVKASGQTSSTTPTASLFLSPGSFSSNTTAPRIIGYRTADFSSAAARSAGLKFGVAQNNVAKDAMWITEAGNVGIGTDSPSGKLHVSTGTDDNDGNIEFFIGGTNSGNARTGKIIKNTSSLLAEFVHAMILDAILQGFLQVVHARRRARGRIISLRALTPVRELLVTGHTYIYIYIYIIDICVHIIHIYV